MMSEERLREIKDSINLQLELSKQLKVDNEIVLEERELFIEVIRLNNIINKAIDYMEYKEEDNKECSVCSVMTDNLLENLKGSDKE